VFIMRTAFPVRAPRALVLAALLLATPGLAQEVAAQDGLANVYATIKPPEDAEAADEAADAADDAAAAEPAEVQAPAPMPSGDGGLANVYATLKPAERLEEDLEEGGSASQARREIDVDTTGALPASLPRTLGGFAAKVEAGAIWVRASAPTRCLPGDLTKVVSQVAERFGAVRIMSTHRTKRHNRRAGGAARSMHLSCRAIDFRVAARGRDVMAYLRDHPAVGGLKMYRSGLIHIDDGEPRSW
jgi:hypothetical protein